MYDARLPKKYEEPTTKSFRNIPETYLIKF